MAQQTSPYYNVSLYVGDLSEDVSEGLLYEIFSTVGTIQMIKVCRDDVTKASLGYAYVNYIDPTDADRALNSLNHTMIKNRPCRIMRQQRDPSRRRLGKGNIYISNLHSSISNKDLYDAFSQFGNILSCKVVLDPSGGDSKGYGYVHFDKEEDAKKAIELVNGKDIRGNTVYANFFVPRTERLKARENSWTNVFFRNAPASFEKEDILQLFSDFGAVNSAFLKQKQFSNETKCYGFANFVNHEDAVAACEALNGKEIEGLPLYCARAQKKSEREPVLKRQKDIKRRENITQYYGRNLYIKHIEDQMTLDMLKEEFSKYGTITSAKIMYDENNTCKGFGFVCYETKEQAQAALDEFNSARNKILPGFQKPLYVALHEPKDMRRIKYANRARRTPNAYPLFPAYPAPPMTAWATPNQFQGAYPPQRPQAQPGMPMGQVAQPRAPVPTPQPAPTVPELPSIEVIEKLPKNERRDIIGRHLFYLIENIQPGYASKITGMLLEWDVQQIYDLVSQPEMLRAAVEQAVNLINQQTQTQA